MIPTEAATGQPHTHHHAPDGPEHDREHGHGHGHNHSHSHSHDMPAVGRVAEAGLPPEGGPVVLDIGGDIGALLAFCDADQLGTELHVRPDGHLRTTHTGVWERDAGAGRIVVAVFPALRQGNYAILGRAGESICRVTVEGGSVTDVDLRH